MDADGDQPRGRFLAHSATVRVNFVEALRRTSRGFVFGLSGLQERFIGTIRTFYAFSKKKF